MGCARVRLKTVTASLHRVVRLHRMRRGNVFVSTRRNGRKSAMAGLTSEELA